QSIKFAASEPLRHSLAGVDEDFHLWHRNHLTTLGVGTAGSSSEASTPPHFCGRHGIGLRPVVVLVCFGGKLTTFWFLGVVVTTSDRSGRSFKRNPSRVGLLGRQTIDARVSLPGAGVVHVRSTVGWLMWRGIPGPTAAAEQW